MFDYVQNRYNKNPSMSKENELLDNYLYVKFLNAPYMKLPKDIDEFLSTHKSKFWYNLNRFEKMFRNDFGELYFEVLKDEKNLEEFLDKVYVLFNTKWKEEYLSTTWKYKEGFAAYKQAMIEMTKNDEGFLAVLFDKDRNLLSYAYCLKSQSTVYFYQHCICADKKYFKYSLGKILIHNLLRYIIAEGRYDKLDFMLGEQPYKLEWAKKYTKIYIKIGKKSFINYIKYYLVRTKIFLQFHKSFRYKIKYFLKLKENFFAK